jgi:3-phenylpropionate/cinnamic acid dioxygenase small subunit|tara:strand:+ start:1433 stop:1903 length:471 start_codon:yes stop_codon:yes gene_type:complete
MLTMDTLTGPAEVIQTSAIALDKLDYDAWLACFTEECSYEITTHQNEVNHWPCGLMHAFSKNQLRDRIASITTVNIYEPHRYRHILSQSHQSKDSLNSIWITGFSVYRITLGKPTILFVTGEYRDQFKFEHSGVTILSRQIVLDNDQIDTLLAIPL